MTNYQNSFSRAFEVFQKSKYTFREELLLYAVIFNVTRNNPLGEFDAHLLKIPTFLVQFQRPLRRPLQKFLFLFGMSESANKIKPRRTKYVLLHEYLILDLDFQIVV